LNDQVVFDVLYSFAHCQPEPSHDRSSVYFILHELIRTFQQLRGNNNYAGGTIANLMIVNALDPNAQFSLTIHLLVLQICEFH
jgi:hypothetical protein